MILKYRNTRFGSIVFGHFAVWQIRTDSFATKQNVFAIQSSSNGPPLPDGCRLGSVTFLERFGKALPPHFHFHCCIIDGVFEKEGTFYPINFLTPADILTVQERVRKRVVKLFQRKGYLSSDEAFDMLSWEHGGFSLDANVLIQPQDRDGLERLIRYCARPIFSAERLEFIRY